MRCTSIAEKICTVCEYIRGISDSKKGSSSRMKNKMGAQKGAFIKMKQENIYIYQREYALCYVPIIGTIKIKLLRKILSFSHQKIILM